MNLNSGLPLKEFSQISIAYFKNRNQEFEAGVIAQLTRYLPCSCKDLHLIPVKNKLKNKQTAKLAMVLCMCDPRTVGSADRQIPEAHWKSTLFGEFWASERPCL